MKRQGPKRRVDRPAFGDLLVTWIAAHARALLYSTGQFSRNSFISLLAVAVIGITLALPAGLFALLDNVAEMSIDWESGAQISAYLQTDVAEARARALATEIENRADVVRTTLITRAQALEEYRALSGFGDALALLEENPLPHLLVVKPASVQMTPGSVERLREDLSRLSEVDIAQFDLDWVLRLQAVTEAAQQGVVVLTALLGVAVSLIIGNTIRMNVFSHRNEIEVAQLFGATSGFVRRPFLYSGVLFGVAGGLVAVAVVNICFAILESSIRALAALYSSSYSLSGLGGAAAVALVLLGALLGYVGSWLAVGRYLGADQTQL